MNIKEALNRVVNQLDLSTEEMQDVMREIMTGQCTDAQIGAFLMGMRMKSETIDEIVGAVSVMRELASHVHLDSLEHVVDVVGTGGDGANIFNVSTAASFVVAAAGGKVEVKRTICTHCSVGCAIDAEVVKYLDLVGIAEFLHSREYAGGPGVIKMTAIGFETLFGALTITGSFMAFGKLQGFISGRPITFPGQKIINAAIFVGAIGLWIYLIATQSGGPAASGRGCAGRRGSAIP